MDIRVASDDDQNSWNQFVFKYSDSPFHLYQWKEILERIYGYRCEYLMAEDRHEIVGIFPVALIKSKLFGVRICSLPFSDYGGTLFASVEINSSLLDLFLQYLSPYVEEANYFEVRSPMQSNVATCLENRLKLGKVKYLTYIIDLNKPFNEIWRHEFPKDLRYAIRKAIRNKIEVLEMEFEEGIHEFYQLYLLTMKRLGSPPHGIEFFSACHDLLGDEHTKLFMAMKSGKVIGGIIVLLGKYTIYSTYLVIDSTHRSLNPGSLLDCRVIEWGCENRFRFFDFGRTLYGSGVHLFKKQWGGKEMFQPYYYLGKKIPQQDPREKYFFLSMLWGKVIPVSVTKKIGPIIKGAIGH